MLCLQTGARCSNAVDTTISHFCQYHALQQAKTLRAPVRAQAKQQQQAEAAAEVVLQPGESTTTVGVLAVDNKLTHE